MSTRAVPVWTIADRLRKAREYAGMDQKQLAERIGVHANSIGNYERGLRVAPSAVIGSWAAVTGVDSAWIETGEEDESVSRSILADLDEWLRARRDSNPQPSDLESAGYYACPFCHVDFTGSESLSKHITVVHGSKSEWAVAA